MARRLWHILRVLYYMMKKGISKHNLLMDLHHLLKCSKIAGKAIGNILAFHPHDPRGSGVGQSFVSTLSCRTMDPNTAFYNPREVEFSCSNTPSYQFHITKRKRHHHHHRRGSTDKYDAAAVARIFDILNSSSSDDEWAITPSPSPSPAPMPLYGRSAVRQLRVTDSPFPVREEEEEEGGASASVDMEAEEFIRRFYEQLMLQQRVATPEISVSSGGRRRSERVAGGGRGGGWSG